MLFGRLAEISEPGLESGAEERVEEAWCWWRLVLCDYDDDESFRRTLGHFEVQVVAVKVFLLVKLKVINW